MSDIDKVGTSSLYAFGIVVEAKMAAFVQMTKKMHPEWSDAIIIEFLQAAVEYAVRHYE